MTIFLLLALHQGEEFVIILPAVMLVGAFFIMRWANQNDDQDADAGAVPSPGRQDVDETTR